MKKSVRVINVENLMSKRKLSLYVDTFLRVVIKVDWQLSLYVDSFGQGALRSKVKLELYVNRF